MLALYSTLLTLAAGSDSDLIKKVLLTLLFLCGIAGLGYVAWRLIPEPMRWLFWAICFVLGIGAFYVVYRFIESL